MIVEQTRKVYTIERYGRKKSYFSLKSACQSVARHLIEKKHPTERVDVDETGWPSGGGFYWKQDIPRADTLYRRMTRIVRSTYKTKTED